MRINSNFQMNHRSIEEFARVMVPEALDRDLDIKVERVEGDIVVELEIDGKKRALDIHIKMENLKTKR